MAILQNPRIAELENQIAKLEAENKALMQDNEIIRFGNRDLMWELEQLKSGASANNLVPIHNARGAGRKPMSTPEDVRMIMDLHGQGNGTTKIYKALNRRFSKSTIYRIVKKSANQN